MRDWVLKANGDVEEVELRPTSGLSAGDGADDEEGFGAGGDGFGDGGVGGFVRQVLLEARRTG